MAKCASCHGATRNGKYQEIAGYNLRQGRDLFLIQFIFLKIRTCLRENTFLH